MELAYLNRFDVVSGTRTNCSILPEAELWTAVILQAIDDLGRRTRLSPRSAQTDAKEWFASEDDAVGSFIWACHVIDIDPSFIRSRLAKKHQIKVPELVMTSRVKRVKMSREKAFDATAGRSRPNPRQLFKRVG